MLRHYDEIGILKPGFISQDNNYRYYEQNQITQINMINILKSFGFHLDEIKHIFDNVVDMQTFLAMLNEKEAVIREKIETDVYNLAQIKKFISTFKKSENQVLNVLENQVKESTGVKMKETIGEGPMNRLQTMDEFYARQKELMEKYERETYFYYVTFDIDRFLMVNETCGFEVGDQVIYRTLEFIRNEIDVYERMGKGFFERTGGDEISLFVTSVTEDEIVDTVRNCIKKVSQFDFTQARCPLNITISAGIAKLRRETDIRAFRHESVKALMSSKHRQNASYQLIEN